MENKNKKMQKLKQKKIRREIIKKKNRENRKLNPENKKIKKTKIQVENQKENEKNG